MDRRTSNGQWSALRNGPEYLQKLRRLIAQDQKNATDDEESDWEDNWEDEVRHEPKQHK